MGLIICLLSIYSVSNNLRVDGTLENLTILTTLIQIISFSSFVTGITVKSNSRRIQIGLVSLAIELILFAASYGFQNSGFFDRMYKESYECVFSSANIIVLIFAIVFTIFLLQSIIYDHIISRRYYPALTIIKEAVISRNKEFISQYLSVPENFSKHFGNFRTITSICRRCFNSGSGR